jgi:hypothetical protein
LASLCLAASTLLPNAHAFSATPTTTLAASSGAGGRHCHCRKRAFPFIASTATTTTSLPAFGGVETVDAWSAVDTFFRTQPETAAFLTCSFKASAADLLAQTQVDESSSISTLSSSSSSSSSLDTTRKSSDLSPPPQPTSTTTRLLVQQQQVTTLVGSSWLGSSSSSIDISRNLGFLLYGGLYTGLAQHYLYNMVYPKIFENVPQGSWMLTLDMVIFDNLVAAPFLCLPVAYIFKTAFASASSGPPSSEKSNSNKNDIETQPKVGFNTTMLLTKGLNKYVSDVTERGLLIKYWSIWLPVQFLTFGVIPEHFRVTFVALVSFFWIAILSAVSAEEDSPMVIVVGGGGGEDDAQPKMV